jgi:HupE / UreJ protein
MSDLVAFVQLGVRHILNIEALDHILFLVALAVIYRVRDWRAAMWVVSAFTVGHSITLALAVTGVVRFPGRVIEFLIPVTIVATVVENVVRGRRGATASDRRTRMLLAGAFGLVHGAGFANYLRDVFVDRVALPLFGFNVGIEIGQVVVLLGAFAALALLDRALHELLAAMRRGASGAAVLRWRVVSVSLVVGVVAARWAVERAPW